jgi:hypothetical protein
VTVISLSDAKVESMNIKNLTGMLAVALIVVSISACSKDTASTATIPDKSSSSTLVSLESDLCGSCGDAKGSDTCCKGEKCEKCKMQKGSALCCTGVEPKEGVTYCKECGFEKGTDKCCASAMAVCDKCGLGKGSPLCCKLKPAAAK